MATELTGALSSILNPELSERDKWRAWGVGLGASNPSGNIGDAYGNAMSAQLGAEMEQRKLAAQYLPQVLSTLASQQRAQQEAEQWRLGLLRELNPLIDRQITGMEQPSYESVVRRILQTGAEYGVDEEALLPRLAGVPREQSALESYIRERRNSMADPKDSRIKTGQRDLGGQIEVYTENPVTGEQTVVRTIPKTPTPANAEANKPPAGYRWSANGRELEKIPGGPAEKEGAVATEGERKAGFLLRRVRNAQQQINEALRVNPEAAKPGIAAELVRKIPFIGGDTPANLITPEARQQVEAAQLDLLDSALTLGTGAAYTKEQLQGYRRSYFPQIGDDPNTVKDKQARLTKLIEAAEVAAGRASDRPEPSKQTTRTSDSPAKLAEYEPGARIGPTGKVYIMTPQGPRVARKINERSEP